ncbi:MAG: TetR/AcrR family transcriptional regulator [Candidatus Lokiarchaeota archaeon]|nr:TetR/AcrR family transcriptional regulator [Candidatus Harpocratesius repetitus]
MKKKRNRSVDLKEQQFNRIIAEAKKIYENEGISGLNIQNIAEQVGTVKGNLYNYVKSKRELWYALLYQETNKFSEKMLEIIKNHKDDSISLIENLIKFMIIDFQIQFPSIHKMLNETPPSAKKIGKFERKFKNLNFLKPIITAIDLAKSRNELIQLKSEYLASYFWIICHGTYYEMNNTKSIGMNIDLRDFVFNQLKDQLKYVYTTAAKREEYVFKERNSRIRRVNISKIRSIPW